MNKAFYFNLFSSGLVVLALLLVFDVIAGQTLLSNIIKSAALIVACIGLGGSVGNKETHEQEFFIEHSEDEEVAEPKKHHNKDVVVTQEPKTPEPVVTEREVTVVDAEQELEIAEESPLDIARAELHVLENKERGAKQKEFFSHQNSDAEREYLGVNISQIVALSEKIAGYLDEKDILALLKSSVHDERILAVWTMINQFKHAPLGKKKLICDFYMAHRAYIDNWDMTDLAARNILGSYVREFGHEELIMELISSESSWDKRSAVMATHPSVIDGNIDIGFFVSEKLIDEEEELIQSAIGWVLKEAYKKEPAKTERFIRDHFHSLSKQAIRIGTERMDKEYRKAFLRGDFEKVRA